jgi:hypothetical protein
VIATSSTVPRWRLRAAIGGGREFRGYVMVLDPLLPGGSPGGGPARPASARVARSATAPLTVPSCCAD